MATVLASYMAGLGAGAAVASKYVGRIKNPVLTYGVLEAGIAITALAVPFLLGLAGWLYVSLLGGADQPGDSGGLLQSMYYLAISFVVLAIPTGFMGATLPLLTRSVVNQDAQLGSRVAWLYGINTAGAVFGTLIAAFVLLPALGLKGTVYVGVAVNAIVFFIAWVLAGDLVHKSHGDGPPSLAFRNLGRERFILPIILLSGANSFLYEVLWTRLLGHVLGGTVYAFAVMLASFLIGITIGGMFAGRFANNRNQAVNTFVVCQIAIAMASAVVFAWIQDYIPGSAGLAENSTLAMAVMLPSSLFIGATFPLAVRILASEASVAAQATALTYSWNTFGAIVGAILAGFFLIPALGFEGAIELALAVNAFLAVSTMMIVEGRSNIAVGASIAVAGALFFYKPSIPYGLIDTSLLDEGRGGRILHYSVGRSSTVLMKDFEGYYYLRTNGLPEAFIEPKGAPPIRHSQKWLTALPVIANPDADSMLIVGFGGGVAVEGVPPSVRDIDVIELEPEVINANRVISDLRRYDPLSDDRVNLIINDARSALALTDKKYDIVVSQPSHPWTAGASHLYTTEFIKIVKGRLMEEGVLLQWINSLFVDDKLLRSLSATLLDNFENVRIYQPAPTIVLFLASDKALELEKHLQQTGRPLNDSVLHYSWVGINSVEDVLVALAADERGVREFAAGAQVNTDDNNIMALASHPDSSGLNQEQLTELLISYDPLVDQASWVFNELGDVNYEYIGNRLIAGRMEQRAFELRSMLGQSGEGLTIEALGLRHQGRLSQSEDSLWAALNADPANMQARYALVWRFLGQLAESKASSEIEQLASGLSGSAQAVVKGWQLGMKGDWAALSDLDRELAQAKPMDLWFPEAVKLRADWRIQGTKNQSTNKEALDLLDRAITVNPLTDLLVIRAGATIRLQDPHGFVETAARIREKMNTRLDLVAKGQFVFNERDRVTMNRRIQGFLRQLDSNFVESVPKRAQQVKKEFQSLESKFEKIK